MIRWRWAVLCCLLVVSAGACTSEEPAEPKPSKSATSAPPNSKPSKKPEPSPTKTTEAKDDGCTPPLEKVKAKWETEDVPFPKKDIVRTRWADADFTWSFTNRSSHKMVVDFALFFVRKPAGEKVRPTFSGYTSPDLSFDVGDGEGATVDPGDTFTTGQQPFGLRDWMDQFPLYSKGEPRTSVSFSWHFKDSGVQARCVDTPARTVPVGAQPHVLAQAPWVTKARFARGGLIATARLCAGDEAEVFDGGKFYASRDDARVAPQPVAGQLKVPVAASACRDVRLRFAGVTSRDWVLTHPYYDEKVPLRWTLTGSKVTG